MATIKDISALLGLSVTTVSRALNGFPEVSADTRARVVAAARDLDYTPNQSARRLVTGRSNMIALVLRATPSLEIDPYVYEIVAGLSAHLLERSRDLIVHVATDADPVAPLRRLVASKTIDGFLLNAPEIDDPRIAFLIGADAPFVLHGRHAPNAAYPFYDLDTRAATRMAAEALIRLGHRRIALVNGRRGLACAAQRLDGYEDAMSAAGLAASEAFVAHPEAVQPDVARFVSNALDGVSGPRPTAFVCASTPLAAGVARAVRAAGLVVGDDVSIIAHDDGFPHLRAVDFDPPLSVTRSPLREACMPLAAMLSDLVDGRMEAPRQVVVQATLTPRASTAPPPPGETAPWS